MERVRDVVWIERHVDGSARGFASALDLAWTHRARLTVVAIADDLEAGDGSRPLTPGEAQRHAARVERWRRRLEGLARQGASRGVPVGLTILRGDPSSSVLRELERTAPDVVMKAADRDVLPWHGRLAPLDRHLLRHSPSPVWILDPAQGPGTRMVLAAVDVGPGRTPELNARIVRTARVLAHRAGAALRVVHAWSVVGEPILASAMTGLSGRRLRKILDTTRRERRLRVEELLATEIPGDRADVALRKGDPVRVIRREARCAEADVVVVGNAARTGLEALLLGNVAERLVARIPGSVLAVRAAAPTAGPELGSRDGVAWTRSRRATGARPTTHHPPSRVSDPPDPRANERAVGEGMSARPVGRSP